MQTLKKDWLRPTLTPHRTIGLNKFGAVRRDAPIEVIDGVPISRLLAEYGSPLFVYSERALRDNARRLHRAFSSRYPTVIHGWSYKTNYLGAICSVFHQEGSWAEVVSGFEYEKARSLGVPGDRIIFNGPAKREADLRRAAEEGARIHIDNFDELARLERITAARAVPLRVGIRINFETGHTEPWSRFGFHLESGQAMEAVRRIARAPRLQLAGIHCHLGTFITDTRAYVAQVHALCGFMRDVEEESGVTIDYLDIGGGFASRNALQGVYLPPEEVVPSFDQYAEAICGALLDATREREARGRGRPTLILETGRAVVDDAGYLLTSVLADKRLPDGRRGLVLDAGVNLLFTAFWYHHPVRATRPLDGVPEETVLYGPLCMNIDVVRNSVLLPPLPVGETLAITPVGAYNNTQWLQFIDYRPNVVMVLSDGRTHLIRAAEDLAGVTANERVPPHLADAPSWAEAV
jgi:diaminopimelate decarboxylase